MAVLHGAETSRRFLPDTACSLLPRSGSGLALSVRVASPRVAMPLALVLASLKEKTLRCASVKEKDCARCLTTFATSA
ncbi:hypothetical protein [Nostoc sp. LPT]|uniref:hypothetical protein n=1 Tax=Nostoc sp. LPT TaxID=2815387 RepID=UPI001DA2F768|nr:hypothetical protein [Nostoc sp. LPT]MBN4006442.1 hypothetical protein [Nostoc sp. LPT]